MFRRITDPTRDYQPTRSAGQSKGPRNNVTWALQCQGYTGHVGNTGSLGDCVVPGIKISYMIITYPTSGH